MSAWFIGTTRVLGYQMHSITYVSAAIHLYSDAQLWTLLEKSRKSNFEHGITGLLLYKNGNFIQTIEGGEAEVKQLYLNICRDPSHSSVIKVFDEPVQKRAFSQWSMGFLTPANSDIPGYSNFLRHDSDLDTFLQNPCEAKHLLCHFRNTIR